MPLVAPGQSTLILLVRPRIRPPYKFFGMTPVAHWFSILLKEDLYTLVYYLFPLQYPTQSRDAYDSSDDQLRRSDNQVFCRSWVRTHKKISQKLTRLHGS